MLLPELFLILTVYDYVTSYDNEAYKQGNPSMLLFYFRFRFCYLRFVSITLVKCYR